MKLNRLVLLITFLSLAHTALFAQWYNPEKVDKKASALYAQALLHAGDGKFAQAESMLQECIRLDSRFVEAYLSLAGVYGQQKNYDEAVSYYEKAISLDSIFSREYKLPYSIDLAGLGKFEEARTVVESLLSQEKLNPNTRKAAEYRLKSYQFAIDYAKNTAISDYVFEPKNMGSAINSKESEYFPSLTIDGKELVFTRRLNNYNEDFFSSIATDTGWDTARSLGGRINTPQNEGAQNISQDGQWLVFAACNRQDGWGSCDIFISYLTPEGWSEAINLGGTINSDQWESQPCLSPDKRDLYFASRRFGGYGGSDIYVSHLQQNGKWSEPENLGPEINTKGDEYFPFIHADNQTLYFSSNGLTGYGKDDLFLVRKGPKGQWSKPENLGYPINTIDDEGSLFISADASTAYFASDRTDSYGGLDIYQFNLRPGIRPHKTLWISGQVYDDSTKQGLPSAVELIDLQTKELISKVQTNERGNYLITLPVGRDYAFNVNRKGYLFYSDRYSLKEKSNDSTYVKNIPLKAIVVNARIVLNNIFFDSNEFELKPESEAELDKLVQLLNENPEVKVQIDGYTDNVGKPADNITLSTNRARAVAQYLVDHEISAQRVKFKGFGEANPVADNKTEEGRAKNRRTELRVIAD